jgi:hypothetical protein
VSLAAPLSSSMSTPAAHSCPCMARRGRWPRAAESWSDGCMARWPCQPCKAWPARAPLPLILFFFRFPSPCLCGNSPGPAQFPPPYGPEPLPPKFSFEFGFSFLKFWE